jgi:hypothetical protein
MSIAIREVQGAISKKAFYQKKSKLAGTQAQKKKVLC